MWRAISNQDEGPRDGLFAAMPSLEAKKALFAFVAGVRDKRREQGQDEVKLMFIEKKKRASTRNVEVCQAVQMAILNEKGIVPMGG